MLLALRLTTSITLTTSNATYIIMLSTGHAVRLARVSPLRSSRRYLSNPPRPQAYLRPLVETNQDEEFEGVMCLVMDRKEAKNALSVQMVGVCRLYCPPSTRGCS